MEMLVCLLEYLLLREDDYFRLFPSYQQRSSIVMAADALAIQIHTSLSGCRQPRHN